VTSRRASSAQTKRRVLNDWFTALPREKSQLFDAVVGRWDSTFVMVSVSLSDAISYRRRGEVVCARDHICLAADLLDRLITALLASCEAISAHGRRIADPPAVEPLHHEFFRGQTGQSAASWNSLLHVIFFGNRARFFRKLNILASMLERLEREFREAVEEIKSKPAAQTGECWRKVDNLHFDLNTCVREAEVMLKSFLFSLPTEQVAGLAADFDALPEFKQGRLKPRLSRAPA